MIEMKVKAHEELEGLEAELRTLLDKQRAAADPERLRLLDQYEEAWLGFCKASCELNADEARGGTLSSWLWLIEANGLTGVRIEQMKEHLAQ